MATLGEYTFLVTNLLTGLVIEEVELSSFHWSEIYNRPGAGRATVRIHHPKCTQTNFNPWQNGLYAVRDGDIKFGGIMAGIQPRAGTGVIDVPVIAFMDYLSTQITESISGMTNASQVGLDIKWVQKDQFQIVDDLVKHAQSAALGRNLGVTTTWAALSGVLRDLTLHIWEHKLAGEIVKDLAARENGFSWYPEYFFESDLKPRCRYRLVYPRRGRKTGYDLTYVSNSYAGMNIASYDLDGGQRPLTGKLHIVGSGEGPAMVHHHIDAGTSGIVRYDDVVAYKDVTNMTTLEEKGRYVLKLRKGSQRQFTILLDRTQWPKWDEFYVADEFNVLIDDGYVQVDTACTVISKEITLSSEHDEDCKITMLEMSLLDALA